MVLLHRSEDPSVLLPLHVVLCARVRWGVAGWAGLTPVLCEAFTGVCGTLQDFILSPAAILDLESVPAAILDLCELVECCCLLAVSCGVVPGAAHAPQLCTVKPPPVPSCPVVLGSSPSSRLPRRYMGADAGRKIGGLFLTTSLAAGRGVAGMFLGVERGVGPGVVERGVGPGVVERGVGRGVVGV